MAAYLDITDDKLAMIATQDHAAFAVLVERYETVLLRYVRRFTGFGKECAEDVVQEVFLKIYRNLNGYDSSLSFSSWAYRIAHNEAVNYLKRHRGKEAVPLERDDEDMGSLINIFESNVNVVDDAARDELCGAVRGVLDALSSKYREVLVLRFMEDKDYTEMSDILKKPMGTIATLLNRAKEEFKKIARQKNIIF